MPHNRWVIKFGSAVLADLTTADISSNAVGQSVGLNTARLAAYCEAISAQIKEGRQVAIVSSGAIGCGMQKLGMTTRPKALHTLQALAAIGQSALVEQYQHYFARAGLCVAQVLITHADIRARKTFNTLKKTLNALWDVGAIPLINENDSTAAEEIRMGDNDLLAGMVADLLQADALMLVTDQEGLYDKAPTAPDANLIHHARPGDPALRAMVSGTKSALGSGGMKSKLKAAEYAARAGVETYIVNGFTPANIGACMKGGSVGTHFYAGAPLQHETCQNADASTDATVDNATNQTADHTTHTTINAKRRWLAGLIHTNGQVLVDSGAISALARQKSLLAAGIVGVKGAFSPLDVVDICDETGTMIARGITNFAHDEITAIMGYSTDAVAAHLAKSTARGPEVVHRDNLWYRGAPT